MPANLQAACQSSQHSVCRRWAVACAPFCGQVDAHCSDTALQLVGLPAWLARPRCIDPHVRFLGCSACVLKLHAGSLRPLVTSTSPITFSLHL